MGVLLFGKKEHVQASIDEKELGYSGISVFGGLGHRLTSPVEGTDKNDKPRSAGGVSLFSDVRDGSASSVGIQNIIVVLTILLLTLERHNRNYVDE